MKQSLLCRRRCPEITVYWKLIEMYLICFHWILYLDFGEIPFIHLWTPLTIIKINAKHWDDTRRKAGTLIMTGFTKYGLLTAETVRIDSYPDQLNLTNHSWNWNKNYKKLNNTCNKLSRENHSGRARDEICDFRKNWYQNYMECNSCESWNFGYSKTIPTINTESFQHTEYKIKCSNCVLPKILSNPKCIFEVEHLFRISVEKIQKVTKVECEKIRFILKTIEFDPVAKAAERMKFDRFKMKNIEQFEETPKSWLISRRGVISESDKNMFVEKRATGKRKERKCWKNENEWEELGRKEWGKEHIWR